MIERLSTVFLIFVLSIFLYCFYNIVTIHEKYNFAKQKETAEVADGE